MKTLLWHAQKLQIESGWRKQDVKRMVRRYPSLVETEVKEIKKERTVAAFITVEARDTEVDLLQVALEIRAFGDRIKINHTTLIPFGHLSNDLAPLSQALEIIRKIGEQYSKFGEVDIVPGGYDKSLLLEVPRHHYNCAWREF